LLSRKTHPSESWELNVVFAYKNPNAALKLTEENVHLAKGRQFFQPTDTQVTTNLKREEAQSPLLNRI